MKKIFTIIAALAVFTNLSAQRYKDKIFTTPHDVPVEKMMWNGHLMDFLKMENTDESSTR
jgi:hypothetical protein